NKCHDYFREKARHMDIPLDSLSEKTLSYGRQGVTVSDAVQDTLEKLGDKEKQILYLAYWKELPQAEIANRLGIPLGTVKSRLHTARQQFQHHYPYLNHEKGDDSMTKLPEKLPVYTIEKSDLPPFSVKWEELLGWMIVPKLGEKLSWGLYDFASKKRTEYTEMEVVGKAEVHGIEGVEFKAIQYDAENYYRTGSIKEIERRFIAQLTDTHCRYLAESHMENGVRKCYTFLDGEPFMNNWGFGPDNCGTEIHMAPKGILHREGNVITGPKKAENLDIVGRYTVTINGKSYDTVCVMDIETFNDSVASEQFLDQNGRTILWRRFNHNNWAAHRYQKPWTELLPNNERLIVNGETYVHWYDCISDYIL
ncbi:MAG: RNA polymerase sigma factor, partial [Clostridia bacterium]|nr:RNA polymerase sigma factor [Clostridia bacterium]